MAAAAASALLPGTGQLLAGARRRGLVLLTVWLTTTGALAWLMWQHPLLLLGVVLGPDLLGWLLAVNTALLVFRVYATVDAHAAAVRRRGSDGGPSAAVTAGVSVAGLLLVVVVVVVPHAAGAYYSVVADDLLRAVFVVDDPAEAEEVDEGIEDDEEALAEEPSPPPPPDPTPEPPLPEEPRATEPPPGETEDPLEPPEDPEPANPWLKAGRVNVALLGSDAGPGRPGDRIDTLVVASIDTESGDAALFSVDRYLQQFPLPEHLEELWHAHCPSGDGWEFLLALYRCGAERIPDELAEIYPDQRDPAAAAVADTLGELLGLEVHHHAMVDMAGFVEVIDALGGVTVDLGERHIRVRMSPAHEGGAWQTFDLGPGETHLDGQEALAYVRMREPTGGDRDRMRRQRCLLASLADETAVPTLLSNLPDLATAVENHVATSIPLESLPDLIELAPRIEPENVRAVGLTGPRYRSPQGIPDVDAIQGHVAEVLDDTEFDDDTHDIESGKAVCH